MMELNLDRDKIFDDAYLRADALLDAAEFNKTNPYNVPGYKPVRQEHRHVPLKVEGDLPEDLEGVYLRTGTNSQFDDDNVRMHAFNGAGMIHQVQIKDGQATYSNAYVRTPKFEVEEHLGRQFYIEFGEVSTGGRDVVPKVEVVQSKIDAGLVPLPTLLERGTGGTSVRYHHGRLYCLTESGYAFVLNTREESGLLVIDGTGHNETWDGEWDGPFSAHPTVDPANDDLYNLGVTPDGRIIAAHIHEGELIKQHTVHHQGNAPGENMAWLHDFFLTKNYIVFPDVSMRTDGTALFTEHASVIRFDPDRPLRWGVLPRGFDDNTPVTWFETSVAGTVWHVINAWERTGADESEEIVLYGPVFASYPSSVPIHTPLEPAADVKTWTLNLGTGTVTDERLLNDHGYERPSMNLEFTGRENRYAYLLDEHGDGYMGVGVCKYDLLDEREAAYLHYGGMYGGEALFVPRKDATAEDDGYLVDLLMAEDHAELVIVDAKDMHELARLRLPQRVPFGVHGCWIGTKEVEEIRFRRGNR
ncbi:carotenoid oxygenase family protein [Amycolatopsis pithecellobii]|uniref:Dioxygenase n=1 Tax=Amycolatopsis pithecellobii TaxID=664692 RepID=A0A6N7YUK0_9PSEU|nr:carotenoid oxygenase family protein [Amycolatopsis pithecellobii]MTD55612.1 carotenoid oxygenase [Amycolatopsis pithecellobii]